jgi:hypothetical protein
MPESTRWLSFRWLMLSLSLLGVMSVSSPAYGHDLKAWVISSGGTGSWQKINAAGVPLTSLRFGDFNGDGKSDVFRADGSKWHVSWSGTGQWAPLNTSTYQAADLRFADFNGDKKTDIFRADGSKWYVSWSGTGQWAQLNSSSYGLASLGFADFNGDGKADVIRTDGSKWHVSWSGTGQWAQLNSSSYGLSELRFADFNGDGKADVFRADGSKWHVSWSGTGQWAPLNTSSDKISDLLFGKFDGDAKADVFKADGSKWKLSSGGTDQWKEINTSSYGLSDLRLGEFTGDGKVDVFRLADEKHVDLTVRRFTSTSLSDANADTILANATNLLQINDGSGDEACFIHLVRQGNVSVFSTGDGTINDQSEYATIRDLPGRVKAVNQINWCGTIMPNIIGCAPTPGNSQLVVRSPGAAEGVLWAHEYGHTRGLPHRDVSNALMNRTNGLTNTRVNSSECASFHQ